MLNLGTERIETPRLLLRPFVLEDAPAVYRNWASDPDVTRYLTWPTHTSPEISAMVVESWVNAYPQNDFYQWAIVPKEFKEPIGSISVVRQEGDTFEIGYCIGKAWWRKGITSEALAAVRDFLFDRVGVRRIEAGHDVNNPGSGAVMKKCGLRFVGIIPQSGQNNQGVCDMAQYALNVEERNQ